MNKVQDNNIRILYLVSRLRRQGPIFQLYNIIKHLDRNKFSPQIVTLSSEAGESMLPDFKQIGIEYKTLGLTRMGGMIFGARKIDGLLRDNHIDLIHIFDYRSTLLSTNHFAGASRVVTCRQSYNHVFGKLLGGAMMKTFLSACDKCERIVAVSNSIRSLIEKRATSKIDVIYNGVDQDKFRPVTKEEKKTLRSQVGLPQNKRIFLSVGFLSKNKGLVTLIKAFLNSELCHSGILVLLGDGHLREKCSSLIAEKSNIRMVGFVENVKDYLCAADIFVSASLTEGCPNAVMEAMACGLPVVLSDIPPHREIFSFNEKSGVLFRTNDAKALSKALSEAVNMNYSESSSAAISVISKHLSANNMSLEYQQLYTQLYNQHR